MEDPNAEDAPSPEVHEKLLLSITRVLKPGPRAPNERIPVIFH